MQENCYIMHAFPILPHFSATDLGITVWCDTGLSKDVHTALEALKTVHIKESLLFVFVSVKGHRTLHFCGAL